MAPATSAITAYRAYCAATRASSAVAVPTLRATPAATSSAPVATRSRPIGRCSTAASRNASNGRTRAARRDADQTASSAITGPATSETRDRPGLVPDPEGRRFEADVDEQPTQRRGERRADQQADDPADGADDERLGVHHAADLASGGADGAQQAQLTAALRDGEREGGGDHEHRDEAGEGRRGGEHLHADPAGAGVVARLQRATRVAGEHPSVGADDTASRRGDPLGIGARREHQPDGPDAGRERRGDLVRDVDAGPVDQTGDGVRLRPRRRQQGDRRAGAQPERAVDDHLAGPARAARRPSGAVHRAGRWTSRAPGGRPPAGYRRPRVDRRRAAGRRRSGPAPPPRHRAGRPAGRRVPPSRWRTRAGSARTSRPTRPPRGSAPRPPPARAGPAPAGARRRAAGWPPRPA